jgi:hypothetical protein
MAKPARYCFVAVNERARDYRLNTTPADTVIRVRRLRR